MRVRDVVTGTRLESSSPSLLTGLILAYPDSNCTLSRPVHQSSNPYKEIESSKSDVLSLLLLPSLNSFTYSPTSPNHILSTSLLSPIRFGFVSYIGHLWSFILFLLLYFPSLALILFSLSFSYLLFPFSPPFLSFLCYTPISLTFSLFFYLLIFSLLWFSFYLSSLILFSLLFYLYFSSHPFTSLDPFLLLPLSPFSSLLSSSYHFIPISFLSSPSLAPISTYLTPLLLSPYPLLHFPPSSPFTSFPFSFLSSLFSHPFTSLPFPLPPPSSLSTLPPLYTHLPPLPLPSPFHLSSFPPTPFFVFHPPTPHTLSPPTPISFPLPPFPSSFPHPSTSFSHSPYPLPSYFPPTPSSLSTPPPHTLSPPIHPPTYRPHPSATTPPPTPFPHVRHPTPSPPPAPRNTTWGPLLQLDLCGSTILLERASSPDYPLNGDCKSLVKTDRGVESRIVLSPFFVDAGSDLGGRSEETPPIPLYIRLQG
ncbi:hypothetical protein C7M84_003746 [Penaeus vannamei]|uniref:Uncharacterized protein n=1 Tax=Penaeus vannamei TaxID=6689 RepID=A0A3R7SVR6_PENVA|nr:hypothetical protein C7M84_003746 [Penaeus vannamei]